jgi:hypothetical protein
MQMTRNPKLSIYEFSVKDTYDTDPTINETNGRSKACKGSNYDGDAVFAAKSLRRQHRFFPGHHGCEAPVFKLRPYGHHLPWR